MSVGFNKSFIAENGREVTGHMWSLLNFQDWLLYQNGYDLWSEKMLPEIKQTVIDSISCAQDSVIPRKCSWEFFGYDIVMIDENYKAWLIEIKSSPACDYSTSVAESYVKKSLSSILDIAIGVNAKYDDSNSKDKNKAIGIWKQIYCGNYLSDNSSTPIGKKITIHGEKLTRRRKIYHIISRHKINIEG